jgi:hypothetical protein
MRLYDSDRKEEKQKKENKYITVSSEQTEMVSTGRKLVGEKRKKEE